MPADDGFADAASPAAKRHRRCNMLDPIVSVDFETFQSWLQASMFWIIIDLVQFVVTGILHYLLELPQDPSALLLPPGGQLDLPNAQAFQTRMDKAEMFSGGVMLPSAAPLFPAGPLQALWETAAQGLSDTMGKDIDDAGVRRQTRGGAQDADDNLQLGAGEDEADNAVPQLPDVGAIPEFPDDLYDRPPVLDEPPSSWVASMHMFALPAHTSCLPARNLLQMDDAAPAGMGASGTPMHEEEEERYVGAIHKYRTALADNSSLKLNDVTQGLDRLGAACSFYDVLILASQ
eukprot:gene8245-1473_t